MGWSARGGGGFVDEEIVELELGVAERLENEVEGRDEVAVVVAFLPRKNRGLGALIS